MIRTNKYGAKIRKLVNASLQSKRQLYECLKCHKHKVKNVSYSVWQCRSCGATFAGGAYSLTTGPGEVATRLIASLSKSK
ncbi:MAG: 50S ribosomal protein L37ae [Candidatus Bilamarchaeaceae archaeon]